MSKIVRSIRSLLTSGTTQIIGQPMKMIIVVRTDLRMSSGKIAAQCSHAAVLCYQQLLDEQPQAANAWFKLGQPKVVLRIDTLEAMQLIAANAQKQNIVNKMVRDAGRTQLEVGTVTAVGLGPDYNVRLDAIAKHLKLL